MPAGGSCLLGSMNLAEFVEKPFTKDAYFDYEEFNKAVSISIKALNEVLDEGLPLHPLQIQRETVKDWRQIGLGIMGLSELFIKLNIKYGSKESIALSDSIGFTMADASIKTSAFIAKQQGSYPKYKEKAIFESQYFLNNTTEETRKLVKKYGLANSQILTIAPTGSLSSMLGISGGIEPIFNISYTRKTESLHNKEVFYKVYTPIAEKYMKIHNIQNEEDLPNIFVTAMSLNYKDRVDMQSVWQKHIDASISSTINLPESTTVKDVEDIYMYAWEQGLKGITIYRENCRRTGILTTKDTKEENDKQKVTTELKRGEWKSKAEDTVYYNRKLRIGCGSLKLMVGWSQKEQSIQDMYVIRSGQGGYCIATLV